MTTCDMAKSTIILVPYSSNFVDVRPVEPGAVFAQITYKVGDTTQKVFALEKGGHRSIGGQDNEQIVRPYWNVLANKGGKDGNMAIKELEMPLPPIKITSAWIKYGLGKSAPAALLKVPVITNVKDLKAETVLAMKGQ